MYSCASLAEARGFPIRKFTDQSLFAAPRNLSQRTTSFIASQCQGIHQMLLVRLITLIINVHPLDPTSADWTNVHRRSLERLILSSINCASICPSWCGQAPCPARRRQTSKSLLHDVNQLYARLFSGETGSMAGQANPGFFIMGDCWDGGDRRDRTDDLKLAKLPLSQLSYVPS
jgi:hypothetical protein